MIVANSLKSNEFRDGVGFKYLGDVVGTDTASPRVSSASAFVTLYKERFKSEPNGPGIGNSYDATMITLLAMQAAGKGAKGAAIAAKIPAVTDPKGTPVEANVEGFKKATALLKAGKTVSYQGATGAVVFDRYGDVAAPALIWGFTKTGVKELRLHLAQGRRGVQGRRSSRANQPGGPESHAEARDVRSWPRARLRDGPRMIGPRYRDAHDRQRDRGGSNRRSRDRAYPAKPGAAAGAAVLTRGSAPGRDRSRRVLGYARRHRYSRPPAPMPCALMGPRSLSNPSCGRWVVSALADDAFYDQMHDLALKHDRRIRLFSDWIAAADQYVPSGLRARPWPSG